MARRRASQNGEMGLAVPRRPQRTGGGSFLSKLVYAGLVLCLCGVIGLGGVVAYYASQLPPIDQLTVPKRPPNIAILASDGSLLANRGETGGRTVSLEELPPYLPKAFVAIEDRRFYDHLGIDPMGIARAVYRNLTHSGGLQGGSTLTQQLAKNLFLTQERTASRKIQEAILALWLERNYTKDQILELYLNRVYFGAGAYGVEAAAQRYYGKSARNVSLSEAAMLAGLVQSPSRLAPNRNPEGAQARAERVIAAMNGLGFITPGMTKTALGAPAEPVRPNGAGSANYAADYVMDVLDDFVGTIESDIVVSTTLEPSMQAAAEQVLVDELNAKGQKLNVSQGAFVALRPDGAVTGARGRPQLRDEPVQPGDLRPPPAGLVLQALRLSHGPGAGLTPDTVREDAPVNIKGWTPENYDRDYRGADHLTRCAGALAQHGGGQAQPGGRAQGRGADGAAPRHHLAAPGQRLARARHLGGHAARARERLCGLRQWGHRGCPLRDHRGEDDGRQAHLQAPSLGRSGPRRRSKHRRHDERDDAQRLRHRHGQEGAGARLAHGWQDRHQRRLQGRLVRGLHRQSGGRRLARQRRRHAHQARVRRQPADGSLAQFHEDRPQGPEAGGPAGQRALPHPGRRRAGPRYANAGESGRDQRQRRASREKNFFEKLFGL